MRAASEGKEDERARDEPEGRDSFKRGWTWLRDEYQSKGKWRFRGEARLRSEGRGSVEREGRDSGTRIKRGEGHDPVKRGVGVGWCGETGARAWARARKQRREPERARADEQAREREDEREWASGRAGQRARERKSEKKEKGGRRREKERERGRGRDGRIERKEWGEKRDR
jgi:hypothetical protein